jgi:hypothetical protein
MTSFKDRWNASRKTTTNSHIPVVYNILECLTEALTLERAISQIKKMKALLVDVALAASIVQWHNQYPEGEFDLASEDKGAWLFILTEDQTKEAEWIQKLQTLYPNGYNESKGSSTSTPQKRKYTNGVTTTQDPSTIV